MKKRIPIKLTEQDLRKIVSRIIKENEGSGSLYDFSKGFPYDNTVRPGTIGSNEGTAVYHKGNGDYWTLDTQTQGNQVVHCSFNSKDPQAAMDRGRCTTVDFRNPQAVLTFLIFNVKAHLPFATFVSILKTPDFSANSSVRNLNTYLARFKDSKTFTSSFKGQFDQLPDAKTHYGPQGWNTFVKEFLIPYYGS